MKRNKNELSILFFLELWSNKILHFYERQWYFSVILHSTNSSIINVSLR